MLKMLRTGCGLTALVVLAACGGDDNNASPINRLAAAGEAAGGMKEAAAAMQEMSAAMNQMSADAEAGVEVESVDFRELRELLPEQLTGLPRTEAGGEKTGAMGMTISKATGSYRGSANEKLPSNERVTPNLVVTITDLGAMRGMAMMGFAAWTAAEIDKETETGHERTTTHKGHPAYEKFSSASRVPRGEIQVVVARRFVVEVAGRGVDMMQIRTALDAMDLARLEAIAASN